MKQAKNKKTRFNKGMVGFTLIETMVAVSIIAVGLVSALTLISNSLFYVSNIQDRLTAANLAQEGIELVRNLRDNNWLSNLSWNNGLADGDYQITYNQNSLSVYADSPLLYNSGSGFYNYDSGTTASYKRKISITNLSSFEMRIVSTVTWQRRNVTYASSAEDHLFNWR
ncbi:hypothetical protein A2567_02300 [Candidatus Azambacteria bacterium RIFOXYD1_FULL_42_11]|uniref:Uncharacterized protein n=4 Tax=Candidatus Azamiibacteriota TaxID=1752741 RepID=A0A0G1C9B5_9BACT|nr:MAG: hypothetical protein UV07_C0002G0014 [Candidatus Azambacteria bacterium GW2011_GWB1_42_17]KKS46208.1 MAG: hypothetical protein UV10_C0006G0016 [Candidatus Azambacteria bacterium GW2011_GWA1_42_19]KKS75591.1 MAG: hypothetical protein UV48_C0009G0024 [Candidatus Azambacteria bacterium GW2011_GWA2_42_9]KKS88801.1 MAG: hypothetical protein UV62_C0002G0049 [Parcubacteria group bacterium GW2011_GWC1_43_11]OGD43246.1 MAG: hypothetical protein A2567_02300 [Candidatus Azambacteria bacterium RIFO